ncbi:hypothetical protein GN958_ATG03283, partial [Phytophthora infestans]
PPLHHTAHKFHPFDMKTNSESTPSLSEELVSSTDPSDLDLHKPVAAENEERQARPPDPHLPAAAPFTKRKRTEDDTFALDEKTAMTNARILRESMALCPSQKKPLKTKYNPYPRCFGIFRDANASRIAGSTAKAVWFELLKNLNRIKSPNGTNEVFDKLSSLLGDETSTIPLRSAF